MTVKDFVNQNQDVLLGRLTEDDYHTLTDGAVVFCITTARGNKPLEERAVRSAGYQMVVATNTTTTADPDKLADVVTVTLTANGYAKLDYITPDLMSETGTKLLYFCKPLPPRDPRRSHHWLPNREGGDPV